MLESTPGNLVEYRINADGLAFDDAGGVLISCYRPDIIYRWREDLGLQVLAEDPEGVAIAAPTNVAFTGPDLRTMTVPNIGRWHLTRFSHPDLQGVPLNYPTRAQIEGN